MTDGFDVSPERLERIAARLRAAGRLLDGHAADIPDAPRAGESSALVARVMSALLTSAGALSGGLDAAATAVVDNQRGYCRAEDAVTGRVGTVAREE